MGKELKSHLQLPLWLEERVVKDKVVIQRVHFHITEEEKNFSSQLHK